MTEQCLGCKAYEILEDLLDEGYDLKDALHAVIEDVTDFAFEEGRLEVLSSINQITANAIEQIINDDECECNCK